MIFLPTQDLMNDWNTSASMNNKMQSQYPPALSPEQEEYLLSNLKDWSIAHGLAVRPAPSYVAAETDPSGALAATAPVTLFPSLFPRACFTQAKKIAEAYSELYSAIASDEEWLKGIVEEYVLSIGIGDSCFLFVEEMSRNMHDLRMVSRLQGAQNSSYR
jgi:hypothetical protein